MATNINNEAIEVSIEARKNGPYIIKGKVNITDTDGTTLDVKKDVIALCRCAHSSNKPFCDGTHRTLPKQDE